MNIQDATKAALKIDACITRENAFWGGVAMIKPTNAPDCCLAIEKGKVPRKGWQPQAEDLIADDWIVV